LITTTIGPARVVWTNRHGGTSAPPYDTANLGDHVGDDPARVAENRSLLATRLGFADPEGWCWLRQVHGTDVVDAASARHGPWPEADAAVTREANLPMVVLTADCAPLALASDDAAAVVHVGWSGLLAGVVEAAVTRLRANGNGAVRAALGPCIRPARYEFGEADLARMVAHFGPGVADRTEWGSPALDIPAGVRAALERVGVTAFDDAGVCTAASPEYFSHRRDGATGRQALIAVIEK
jgi:YfiH family protein